MTIEQLQNRAYELCLMAGRYEIIADLSYMDCLQLTGLIASILRLHGD